MKLLHRRMIQRQASAVRSKIRTIEGEWLPGRRANNLEVPWRKKHYVPLRLKGLLRGLSDVRLAQLYRALISNDYHRYTDHADYRLWLNYYNDKIVLLSAFDKELFGFIGNEFHLTRNTKVILHNFHGK